MTGPVTGFNNMYMLSQLAKVHVIASPKGVAISQFLSGDCFTSFAMTSLPESWESISGKYSLTGQVHISTVVVDKGVNTP